MSRQELVQIILKEFRSFLNRTRAECLHGMSPRNVSTECFHGMFPKLLGECGEMCGNSCSAQGAERVCGVSYRIMERVPKPYPTQLQKDVYRVSRFVKLVNMPLSKSVRQVAEPGYMCMDALLSCTVGQQGSARLCARGLGRTYTAVFRSMLPCGTIALKPLDAPFYSV